ncbi:MAG TPA: hypothetical protein ENK93_02950 [Campylobacteraceae bacterium]|nr:hypothetical protein [Campylobacteraceae bacterium]
MGSFYVNYLPLIFTVHIFSAIVWIGGMVGFSLTVYPSVMQIPNEKMSVRTALRTLNRFFKLLVPVTLLLGISGFLMASGRDYAHQDPVMSVIVTSKELLWLFMAVLYLYAWYKIKEARARCLASDSEHAKDNVKLIAHYIFGIASLLGFCAVYFGYILRSV